MTILILACGVYVCVCVCVCVCVFVQDSTYAELDDLRENRSYTVELQAVSYWGQVPLKSSKAIFQFTTSQRQSGTKLFNCCTFFA